MEQNTPNKIWWQPALEVFGQASAWATIPIILSLFIGRWLDYYFGTRPYLFFTLTAIGFLISMFGITKLAFMYARKNDKKDDRIKHTN
jgi:F0F1-type ATP synthase assembly protein I